MICWVCSIVALLIERTLEAVRSVEYARAELAAMMGSMQLDLVDSGIGNDTDDGSSSSKDAAAAVRTFRVARERLESTTGCGRRDDLGRTDNGGGDDDDDDLEEEMDSAMMSNDDLDLLHWGRLWSQGWHVMAMDPLEDQEGQWGSTEVTAHATSLADDRAASLQVPLRAEAAIGSARTMIATVFSCGALPLRRAIVHAEVTGAHADEWMAWAWAQPVARALLGYCIMAAAAVLYLKLGASAE